jgi:MFS transporter, DHA2 family, multidrug resistance protein
VLGLSPLEAGLWTLPWALAFVVGSQLTPRLAQKYPPAPIMAGGLVMAAVGFAMFTQLESTSGFAMIVIASVLFSLGTAPVFTLTNDLIIGSAPPERAGAAAGISETAAELGGALGIALLGTIGLAVYRSGVVDGISAAVPADAAAAAQDTLGGAVEVAGELPSQLGAPLLEAAQAAFVQGVHVTSAISALGAVALAVFAWVAIGRSSSSSGAAVGAEPDERVEVEPPAAA